MAKKGQNNKYTPVRSDNREKKEYNYSKNETTLNFNLNLGKVEPMREFVELMKAAIVDVERDIDRMQKIKEAGLD